MKVSMLPCQQIELGRAAATRVRNRQDETPGQGATYVLTAADIHIHVDEEVKE